MKNYSHIKSWRDYRGRVRLFFVVWFGGFLIASSLAYALSLTSASSWLGLAIGLAWVIGFVIAAARLQLFRCPRCHNQFFKAFWYYWPFARYCVHCGLPKWQE